MHGLELEICYTLENSNTVSILNSTSLCIDSWFFQLVISDTLHVDFNKKNFFKLY